MRSIFSFVRIATVADISAMIPVINAAFAIETFLDGRRTDEGRLAEMTQTGDFLLGYDRSGELVASVYVEVRGTQGYFGMLAVSPSHQGQGLGRAMVETAEDHCRKQGCTAMDLTVLSLRQELPPFYSRLGYAETGTEEFHPSRPLKAGVRCHCILMSKTL
jgi:ribosomal protein S18 acetylase RimI-like enzyme